MKKILIFGIIFILLIVGVVAKQVILPIDEISTDAVINEINNQTLTSSNLTCTSDFCYKRFYKGEYNLGKIVIDRYECKEYSIAESEENPIECLNWKEYGNETLEKNIDKEIDKYFKSIAKGLKERKEKKSK